MSSLRMRSGTARRQSSSASTAARRRACGSTTAAPGANAPRGSGSASFGGWRSRVSPVASICNRSAAAALGPKSSSRRCRGEGLIAEDDPVIALGLVERVRSLGHEAVGPAADGAEAVESARANTPDLYLFDIEMPNLDGLEAAQQLAAEGLRRPVVVVTGIEDESLVERSIASGVGAYLTKPIDT